MARTKDAYKLYAIIVVGLILLVTYMNGNGKTEDPSSWLEDLGGRVMFIGPWEGHEECWGSTVGAVACSDGHREQW